jgi:hypothetical protein
MSIFKSTFKDYIANQIKARQDLLNSQGTRPLDVQKYTSGKAPWVKMTSFVDYADPKKGDEPNKNLAKQYVLMGGTLYPDPNDTTDTLFKLRSGILSKDSAYGTNLGTGTTNKVNLQYGIRPMPGITSVNVKSKSAYGSLREAVVKFYAWDVHQLEDLLILYMRPGYPVLLEWGNSMYIDNVTKNVRDFNSPTINCFKENITQEAIYTALENYRKQFFGNYDGMLGLIRNYETSMLPNGGFECTTTLISIGDVIDSIKMNSETGTLKDEKENEHRDEFETFLRGFTLKKPFVSTDVVNLIDSYKAEASSISDIDTNIYIGRNKYSALTTGVPVTSKSDTGTANTGGSDQLDSAYPFYMQLGYFIFLLSKQKSLYTKDGGLLDIEIPLPISGNFGDGTCIASDFSMAIDIDACIIQNSNASIIKTDITGIGYRPDVVKFEVDNGNSYSTVGINEYIQKGTGMGIIGNVYVNIGRMIDLYKNEGKNHKGNVYLGKYIKSILREIEFSLGSINDFDIFTLENKLVIIDKHYTENPSNTKAAGKFQLNILGTNTTVKNQKIVSKIFPSQATIIAIAAQSRKNVSSLQSSTYSQMNAGLKSRLFPFISESEADLGEQTAKEKNIYLNNVKTLLTYVQDKLLPFNYSYNAETNKQAFNTILNSFLVKIAKATEYKGIIPVSLEVTMDGVGGITIGEIFRINNDILPREYAGKGVGFIVTGISQDITRPEWNTSLHTQFCLLDQADRQDQVKIEVAKIISSLQNDLVHDIYTTINSVAIYNAFVGFFSDLYRHRFNFDVTITNNGVIVNSITYKKDSELPNDSLRPKYLEAALENYKPKYNGTVITVKEFLNIIKINTFSVLTDMFLLVNPKRDLFAKSSDQIMKKFIDVLNQGNSFAFNLGYEETTNIIYNSSGIYVSFNNYDKIKEIMFGKEKHPNKYLMYDPIKREGMDSKVLKLLIENYGIVTKELITKSKDIIIFQQYKPEQSTNNTGEFIPVVLENKLLIANITQVK